MARCRAVERERERERGEGEDDRELKKEREIERGWVGGEKEMLTWSFISLTQRQKKGWLTCNNPTLTPTLSCYICAPTPLQHLDDNHVHQSGNERDWIGCNSTLNNNCFLKPQNLSECPLCRSGLINPPSHYEWSYQPLP